MFRIRRVPDDTTETNALAIRQVQQVLREQFPLIAEAEVQSLPAKLRDPLRYGWAPCDNLDQVRRRRRYHGCQTVTKDGSASVSNMMRCERNADSNVGSAD